MTEAPTAAAEVVLDTLRRWWGHRPGRWVATVAGESGSGKTTLARAVSALAAGDGLAVGLLHLDDYFFYPPLENHRRRTLDPEWVGPREVQMDRLEAHVRAFIDGVPTITVPHTDAAHDRFMESELDLSVYGALLVEGTYATRLEAPHFHVFIDRHHTETLEGRRARGRDVIDDVLIRVLEREHALVAAQKDRAHVVVDRAWTARVVREP